MEPLIGGAARPVCAYHFFHFVQIRLYRVEIIGRSPYCCFRSHFAFNQQSGVEQLERTGARIQHGGEMPAAITDVRPGPGANFHEARDLECYQSLAHRRPAYAKLLSQILFGGETSPGRQRSGFNLSQDAFRHLLIKAFVDDGIKAQIARLWPLISFASFYHPDPSRSTQSMHTWKAHVHLAVRQICPTKPLTSITDVRQEGISCRNYFAISTR